ncbi:MAG: hypothetical protein PHC61_08500, partial [Chitinivibrionales bacterium]|nr:hypothetical protein [Chitinivibrionales bacterium]
MPRLRLFWKLYFVIVCITLVLLGSAVWYVTATLSRFYITETKRELKARAALMKELLPLPLMAQKYGYVDSLCKKVYATTQ